MEYKERCKSVEESILSQVTLNRTKRFIANVSSTADVNAEMCTITLLAVLPGLRAGHVLLLPHLHCALPPIQPLRVRRHLVEPLLRNLGRNSVLLPLSNEIQWLK